MCTKMILTDASNSMSKAISESKSFHFHIYSLEEIINNPLDEAFQKPLLAHVISRIMAVSAVTQYCLQHFRLIRQKCKQLKV